MASVAEALRAFAPGYLKRYGARVPLGHKKVLDAITRCRTGELGEVVYECETCGRHHFAGRSCGNRHCPTCQFHKTQLWLTKQSARLLPVHHFLVTFTVPKELRMPLRANQGDGYRALFDAAADSLRDVGSATRALQGCRLGYFGVLHTWGRDPRVYHPHMHFVVPGGGVQVDAGGNAVAWKSTAKSFLMHHETLIRVYKAKLTDNLRACGIYDEVSESAWMKKSVVDIQPVGNGRAVVKYLAPYVHRVAISDKRIVSVDDTHVTYTVTPSGSSRPVTRRVPGETFVGGFVQHVLPRGFQKIRYYGWMSPNSRIDLEEVRWLACSALGLWFLLWIARRRIETPELPPLRCRECGGRMKIIRITRINCRALVNHCVAYLDSG